MTESEPKRIKLSSTDTKKHTVPIHRHKFKSQWLRKHSSLLHCPQESDTGLIRPQGVMVSCSIKSETRALGQARAFLDEEMNHLFPESEPVWGDIPSSFLLDIDLSHEENKALDPPSTTCSVKKDRKFQAVDAACAGNLFFRFRVNVTPTQFILALFDHVAQLTRQELEKMASRISHCTRFVPIEYTFPANMKDIEHHLCLLLPLQTHLLDSPSTVCAIVEVRNNTNMDKNKIKNQVASFFIQQDSGWKIDLKAPKWVVYVCVFKSVASVSFLPDYFGYYKKYNLSAFIQHCLAS